MRTAATTVFIASLLAACGGGAVTQAQHVAPTCGPPPPSAAPNLQLVYPEPAATDVPASIAYLVISGDITTRYGTGVLSMQSSSGIAVPVGAYTAAPSPLPTPHATPAGGGPYIAAALAALSPATTYSVKYAYTDYTGVPPSCIGSYAQPLGSFTTQ